MLKAPDIPSILVETAFISNPEEEARLRDPRVPGASWSTRWPPASSATSRKNPPLARNRHVVKTLSIVWHSMTGGSRQMAEAAAAAAALEDGVNVRLLHAAAAGPDDVLAADGYLFATPENLASMLGPDEGLLRPLLLPGTGPHQRPSLRRTDLCRQRRQRRGAADRAHLHRLAAQVRVAPALIVCTHAQTPKAIQRPKQIGNVDLARCRELGSSMASGLALGIYRPRLGLDRRLRPTGRGSEADVIALLSIDG